MNKAALFLAFAIGMLTFAGYRALTTSWHPSDCQMLEALGVTPQAATASKPIRPLQSRAPMPNRTWRT